MGARKIQDEGEVIRWFEEGKTYQWMVEEYRRKYNIETVPSLWGNFRRRRGLQRRITRNDELIPWQIKPEHRWLYPVGMLRVEARRREKGEAALSELEATRLGAWKQMLQDQNAVVHYDPDTEEGFFYIPRQEGDGDLVHKPKKTTRLKAAD
ncbi:immunity repressor [Streptomyces phage Verse]|uniref:Immunity repressor n=2 Tax=Streptomyces phage Amela TaxID=1673877 RepID=A0A0K1Y9J0_9CAUD|nr:transcriptional repressor [Streptomyces phage Amela]AKY03785.1 immunity repressor [Streptomyces phage Amela]AKY03860.1 immunity repressor [Streptomyces phage Verse]